MKDVLDVNFEPACAETINDPFPSYRALRQHDPVHWNPKGFWFVSRYDDVLACLKDTRLSNRPAPFALVHARNKDKFAAADIANNLVAFKDAPAHTKLRGWLARSFLLHTQRREDHFSQLATECSKCIEKGATVDVVSEYAVPLASKAICSVLGIPENDADQVAEWSDDFFRLFHAIPNTSEFKRLNDSLVDFRHFVLSIMRERRASRGSDIISELMSGLDGLMTEHEVADNVMLLAADGIGNVQAGLSNCLSVILEQDLLPKQLHGATDDIARLVDECLRLESPGQYQGRIATEQIEIEGKSIRRNAIVLLGFASANRDETVFEDADSFLPSHRRPRHLAFGAGPHMCMGSAMARMEIVQALRCLYQRPGFFEAVETNRKWMARPGHRWLEELKVKVLG